MRKWLKRFIEQGVAELYDAPCSGHPRAIAHIIATALTNLPDLKQPFSSWTYQRLNTYLREE